MGSIIFVDSRVPEVDTLLAGLGEGSRVVLLDTDTDGIEQILHALTGVADLSAIHIISHGAAGTLFLGSTIFNESNLSIYSTELAWIGTALSDDGDILLYGCDVASGIVGINFIQGLAQVTQADVAASTDLTGASFLGGNWVLEENTNSIEATSLNIGNDYQATLIDTIPGDTSSLTTLNVNSSATSTIDYFGDYDWWKVYLTQGYQYQVWIEGSSSGSGTLYDPYLEVYNSVGTFQLGNDDYSLYTLDSYLTVTPNSTGYFYLSAEESGNNGTGTYTITIWQDELASVSSAASVTLNSTSPVGHIGWQGDTADWYAITLTAGVQYQFDLIGSPGDGWVPGLTLDDPWLALRGSTGSALHTNDDSGLGLNSRIFYTPTTSGTYFLDVQKSGVNAYGTYRIVVNSTPTSGVLTVGTPQTGAIDFAGDIDLYSVSLTARLTYAFAVDGSTLNDSYLEVLDSAGATQDHDDDGGPGLNAYLTFTPTSTGTFFLAARESGNDATGSYSAQVWQLPSVSIANASVVEDNSGTTNLVFTVTLSSASPIPVTVTASTSGTATATYSTDYVPASASITFAAGQTSANFTVQILGDSIFEPTESLHVLLSSPVGVVLGASDAYGFIADNDNPYSLPSDSFIGYQWYLYPTTGINVFPVWNDYTGNGVRVAVFDQGIDPNHPDLDSNLLTSLGRNASNLSVGGAPILSTDNHGTAVAGTIAAERDGSGIVGVAYSADLVSIYNGLSASEIPNAFRYAANYDILNNSWGFAPQGFTTWSIYGDWAFLDNFLTPNFSAAGAALANLAASGRNGMGTIVVQSAGNSFDVGDDTNLHNFQNSQYIITVAATDYFGNVTSYSSPGASVLVAAPGGGGNDPLSNIITTDRVGVAGNDVSDYTSIAGTSFSAPIVSGVVALMLEANPDLGYRDVQEILAYSARKISSAQYDWEYNGATNWNGGGLHYDALDHKLGYGLIDATAAVRLAESWGKSPYTVANRAQLSFTHSPALVIPDNIISGAFDSISVSQSIEVERVEVTLNVTHSYVGDLSVLLLSPAGTTSFLLWRPQQNALSAYGTDQNDIHFTFDTVLNWGESSVGNWSLSIVDWAPGYIGRLDSWTLNLIGKPTSADDTYIYTNEFSESCIAQPTRATLTDTTGIDTLNAAACSSNLTLNLVPGSVCTIDGQNLTIAAGTIIENVHGGDGNDTIIGNDTINQLYGGRGNDILNGGAGADILDGGAGIESMIGGDGSDTYYVDNAGDVVTETNATLSTGGTDTVCSYLVAYTLGANVENGRILSTGGADLTGNTLNNLIYAGSGNNILNGDIGADTVSYSYTSAGITVSLAMTTVQATGASGNDTLIAIENLTGSNYDDILTGNTGNNTLTGGFGKDILNGSEGNDTSVFQELSSHYIINTLQGKTYITQFSGNTDGKDILTGIEFLNFSDGTIATPTDNFSPLDYIASYGDLIDVYGANAEGGATHFGFSPDFSDTSK